MSGSEEEDRAQSPTSLFSPSEYEDSSDDLEVVEEQEDWNVPGPRRVARQVFRDQYSDTSIAFFFHDSVKAERMPALIRDIEKHGGTVVDQDHEADTVLVANRHDKHGLENAYILQDDENTRNIYVEWTSFIKQCITSGTYHHLRPRKPMHGIAAGQGRTAFTSEDDENLCQYIARKIPDESEGGHQSLLLYEELLDLEKHMPFHYGWVKRHTATSWKQRFKKNAARFKIRIAEIVETNPPLDRARFQYSKHMTHAARMKRRQAALREEDEESSQSEDEVQVIQRPPRKRGRSGHASPGPAKTPRYSLRSKGKRRAHEEEEEEQEEQEDEGGAEWHEDNFVDDGPEPEMPGGFSSLEPTFTSSSNHLAVPTASFSNTQATLVATPPRLENSRDTTTNSNRNRHSASRVPISPQNIAHLNLAHFTSPQAQSSPVRPSRRAAQSSNASNIPRKAARRPKAALVKEEEASSPPRRPIPSGSMLPPPPPTRQPAPRRTRATAETQAEERDVENLLTVGEQSTEQSTASNRDPYMENDDAVTRDAPGPPVPSFQAAHAARRQAREALKRFTSSSTNQKDDPSKTRAPAPTSAQPRSTTTRLRQSRLVPPSGQGYETSRMYPPSEPRTPAPRIRQGSISSVESFPASGTKAQDLKKSLQLMVKRTPYKPPEGTRASQLSMSR